MIPGPGDGAFKYDAFISYRHGGDDALIAERLHQMLEGFRTPASLVKAGIARRLTRVFRDRDELPTSSDLSDSIIEALKQSRFLIIVCSPRSMESKWIAKEIDIFRALGRHKQILTLLIDGEPSQAFPPALIERQTVTIRGDNGEEQQIEQLSEPLAADIRSSSVKGRIRLLKAELLRLLAPILGCGYDDLRQRQQARERRRLIAVFATLAVAATIFAGLAGFAWMMYLDADMQRGRADLQRAQADQQRALADQQRIQADQQRAQADLQKARADQQTERAELSLRNEQRERGRAALSELKVLGSVARSAQEAGDIATSGLLALKGWDKAANAPATKDEFEPLAIYALQQPHERLVIPADATGGWYSRNNRHLIVITAADGLLVLDRDNGALIRKIEAASATVSRNGERILVGDKSHRKLRVLDGNSYDVISSFDSEASEEAQDCPNQLSTDGRLAAICSNSEIIQVFNTGNGKQLFRTTLTTDNRDGGNDTLNALEFSPDGQRLVVAAVAGTTIIDLRSQKRIFMEGCKDRQASFSPSGDQILSIPWCSGSKEINLWNSRTGKLLRVLNGHNANVVAASFSPDGKTILSFARDSKAILWNASTGQGTFIFDDQKRDVLSAAFDPKGERVVTSFEGGLIKIHDAKTGGLRLALRGHENDIRSVAFDGASAEILTASEDHTTRAWTIETGDRPIFAGSKEADKKSPQLPAGTATLSPDGRLFAVMVDDGTITIYERQPIRKIVSFPTGFTIGANNAMLRFDPTGEKIVMSEKAGESFTVFEARTGKRLLASPPNTKAGCADIDKETKTIAVCTDTSIVVTEIEQPNRIKATIPLGFKPEGVRFDRTSRMVLARSDDRLEIRDLAGKQLLTMERASDSFSALFNPPDPDAKFDIADFRDDHTIVIYAGGKLIAQDLAAGSAPVVLNPNLKVSTYFGDFSPLPDGQRAAWADDADRLKLVDLVTGQELGVLTVQDQAIRYVSFTADGKIALILSDDLQGKGTNRWSLFFARSFPSRTSTEADLKKETPRCLSPAQLDSYFGERDVQPWCIENEKWPYQTAEWKDWLLKKATDKTAPIPAVK